jgi:hypothetical protein
MRALFAPTNARARFSVTAPVFALAVLVGWSASASADCVADCQKKPASQRAQCVAQCANPGCPRSGQNPGTAQCPAPDK